MGRSGRRRLTSLALLLNVGWAATYPLSKHVMNGVPPLALTGWRTLIAAVVLLPLLRRSHFPERGTRPGDWLWLTAIGVVGFALPTALQYLGTVRTLAANVSLIIGLEPVAVALLASCVLAERMGPRMILSFILAFLGVCVISVDLRCVDLISKEHLSGNLLVLASILCYAFYTIGAKKLSPRWGSLPMTGISLALGAAVFVPGYALCDPEGFRLGLKLTAWQSVGIFIIAVPGTALGYVGWNWLLARMPLSELSRTLYIQPIAGALISRWALGEKLEPTFFLGAGLVLGAISLGRESAPLREVTRW